MATNEHTQALFDAVRKPQHCACSDVEELVRAINRGTAAARKEAATMQELHQEAEIAEEDNELRVQLEMYLQKSAAIQRICGKLEKEARDLLIAFRELHRQDMDVRANAQKRSGYKGGIITEVVIVPEEGADG